MEDVRLEPAGVKRRRKLIKSIRLPHVSGKASAAVLVACFALTAALIPMALRLPVWIDFEIVLAAWWLIWAAVLGRLFYHGQPIADDHRLGEPRWWIGPIFEQGGRAAAASDPWWWFFPYETDGCVFILVVIAGIVALLSAAWFVVEIAVPAVAFLLYFLVRGMLARALNVDHGCKNRLLASVGRGFLWATLYTAPLARPCLADSPSSRTSRLAHRSRSKPNRPCAGWPGLR